jgi:ribosomal-protein-alanine N-acetyltransferase
LTQQIFGNTNGCDLNLTSEKIIIFIMSLPEPILGEISAFTIATPDLQQSLAFYNLLGFKETMRADWPFPWIQISDGTVLIMLRLDTESYIALTYYAARVDEVATGLRNKGIVFVQEPKPTDKIKRYLLQSPDGLLVSLVGMVPGFVKPAGLPMLRMDPKDYHQPSTYHNKVCGMFGEYAHPVKDIKSSIAFWELLGFHGVSEYAQPYPWAIMTDGLSVIGLHEAAHFQHPAITYFAADMQAKISALRLAGLTTYTEQGPGNIAISTPENQHIFLYQLGGDAQPPAAEEAAPTQAEIATERLLLRALNPEIMDWVFSALQDDEIMAFLGLTALEELAKEKQQHKLGLSSYRSTFLVFLIVLQDSGKIIGKAGYHTWHVQHARAEIGYHIEEQERRKGYMREALEAIIDYGFVHMELNRIEALIGTANEPSLKLVRGFGFTEEGTLREHYCKAGCIEDSVCFSLLRREYTPAHRRLSAI